MVPIRILLRTKDENILYRGSLTETDNNKLIQYLDENKDTVKVFIGENQVVIDRSSSVMDFNLAADSEFEYKTEFGSLLFRLNTRSLQVDGQKCEIEYALYDEYDNLAFINVLTMEYSKE